MNDFESGLTKIECGDGYFLRDKQAYSTDGERLYINGQYYGKVLEMVFDNLKLKEIIFKIDAGLSRGEKGSIIVTKNAL
jgi:hypothetical protein